MKLDAANLLESAEEHMMSAVDGLQREFATVRTGKASPALVEHLQVDYYGSMTPLRQIAGITSPEPRLLVIQPWDQNAIKSIEKAILTSDLGISPVSDGRIIRLPIPELSEERRRDLAKLVRARTEAGRVEVRTIRREANDAAKKRQKDGKITEDDLKTQLDGVQKLTDQYIAEVEKLLAAKEKELMQL